MTTQELIKILKDEDNPNVLDYIDDAITALEAQQERIAELVAERDAAIADLTLVCVEGNASCDVCVWGPTLHVCDDLDFDCNCCPAPCPCKSCRLDSNWQWRGMKGIKEDEI